jgi:hypothetical protein
MHALPSLVFGAVAGLLAAEFATPAAASMYSNQTGLAPGDIAVLRIALTAERLESAFYNWVVDNSTFYPTFPALAKQYVPLIQAHENAHVAALVSVLGAHDDITCTTYPFASLVHDYQSFLGLAVAFENLGVSAYDYAAAGLSDPTLLTAAATIATIEGRHAAVLSVLQGSDYVNFTEVLPGNVTVGVTKAGFDSANSPSDVASVLTALNLLSNCSAAQVSAVVAAINAFTIAKKPKHYKTQRVHTETLSGMPAKITLSQNDIAVLNYATVLEGLEYTFYKEVKANFSEDSFTAAGFPAGTYTYLTIIAAHEKSHYDFLQGVLGAEAPIACNHYNWANNTGSLTPQQVIMLANVFETTGVSAYDGAIDAISTPGYASAAATIATVEARHSSYLRNLTSYLPDGVSTPMLSLNVSFDVTLLPSQVVQAITPFLTYCTDPKNFPKYLPTSRLNTVKKKHGRRLSKQRGSLRGAV